jgi:hypothetical protein
MECATAYEWETRSMRKRFEFSLYPIGPRDVAGGIDPTLALMGAQGWEIRGIAHGPDGALMVALQRPLDEDLPLPDGPTLAASLEEPLVLPPDGLETLVHPGAPQVGTL